MPKGIRKDTKLPKKMGRKKIPIDWKQVEEFLIIGASGVQIAATLGISDDTLYERCQKELGISFSAFSVEKREKGNLLIHRKQWKALMGGDKSMLVWLGKNRLGQADKFESKIQTNSPKSQKKVLALPENGRRTPESNG